MARAPVSKTGGCRFEVLPLLPGGDGPVSFAPTRAGESRRQALDGSAKAGNGGFRTKLMATSPFKFLQEVREETRKVTWPTRRETMITTAMVFVMVAIASIFFLVADQLIRIAVTFVLGIAAES